MPARYFETSIGAFEPDGKHSRFPRRPEEEWTSAFWSKFDAHTAFTDVFRLHSDVHVVGPALDNLAPVLEAADWSIDGEAFVPALRDRHLMHHTVIENVGPADKLTISGKGFTFDLPVRPAGSELFEGRRVLLTVSRNNPLLWLKDWMRFHRDVHGADAVLIVDNGSTDYCPQDILRAMRDVNGFETCVVVSIDVPYGPGPNMAKSWDANFMQFTAIEHMRWRFLSTASGVLQGDIDELVVPLDEKDVFTSAQSSDRGVLMYAGEFFPPLDAAPNCFARHRSQTNRDLTRPRSSAKYTVAPTVAEATEQWLVHAVRGHSELSDEFFIAHLQAINTGWKNRYAPQVYTPEHHEAFVPLIDAYSRVDWDK